MEERNENLVVDTQPTRISYFFILLSSSSFITSCLAFASLPPVLLSKGVCVPHIYECIVEQMICHSEMSQFMLELNGSLDYKIAIFALNK